MALAGAIDAIGPVQAGVEPLRAVGRALLRRQHMTKLVIESAGVGLAVEIAALPSPISPGAGQAVEHLLGGMLTGGFAAASGISLLAPEKIRHAFFGRGPQSLGHAGLAEIFLRQHIGGHLAPAFGHFDAVLDEYHRAVRITDLASGETERDPFIGRMTLDREMAANAHGSTSRTMEVDGPSPFGGHLWRTVPRPPDRPDGRDLRVRQIWWSQEVTGPKYGHDGEGAARQKVVNARLPTTCCVCEGAQKAASQAAIELPRKIFFTVFHHSVTRGWGRIVDKESKLSCVLGASWRERKRPL